MIYIVILILLTVFTLIFDFRKIKIKDNSIYYFLLFIFILISGLRWKVGGDTIAYQSVFKGIPTLKGLVNDFSNSNYTFEPLFTISLSIVKTFTDEFWVFQIIHAVFVNTIIFRFIKKYCEYKFFALLLYFFLYFVYFNMEILRESIAVSIFLLMYPLMEKKKLKKYYVLNIIAILFHYSSIILLVFPLLNKIKLTPKSVVLLICIVLALSGIFIFVPEAIQAFLFTESLSNKFNVYSIMTANINGTILNTLLFIILPAYVIKLNKKNINRKFDNLVFAYFLIAAIFVLIAGFGRFLNYFGIFMIIYFTNTLSNLNRIYRFNFKRFGFVMLSLTIICYYKVSYYLISYDHLVKDSHKYNMYYPYYSVFNPVEDKDRETLYFDSMWESFNKEK
ncbi:EpsG family protein [Chryseobacterium sp. JAH]|uniref:EpsG family protein n=1 Tax=Chryseobacterium sp. JAH TaxID=1742858 RepID=UPI000740F22E|nr:EpsG family protein [Chryseobacterium sp. JAH]KUJ50598.1 hypothetical protein AR685_14995 [Chryseobacterium sp. JAH]